MQNRFDRKITINFQMQKTTYVLNLSFLEHQPTFKFFLSKIDKRVVLNKDRVVGNLVSERIGVWAWQLSRNSRVHA